MAENETAYGVLTRLSRNHGGLGGLHVQVADRCNHACQHCYQIQGLKGELTTEQLVGIFGAFREAGGLLLTLSGGEITLRDDLVELLEAARRLNLLVILYTNAYLMDSELAAAVARASVWRADVSLYSDLADEHDAVTRVPGSFQRTLTGIAHLREAGVRVMLKVTLTRFSSTTAERMLVLARRLDCEIAFGDHVAAGEAGWLAPTDARPAAGAVAALDGLHADNCAPPVRVRDSWGARAPCGAGASGFAVRSDGRLTPCSNLSLPIADYAPDQPLKHAIERSEVAQFFKSLSWNDLHGCRDCDLKSLCGRCHASALSEVGDMLAPYPGACEVAAARHEACFPPRAVESASTDDWRGARLGPFSIESDGSLGNRPDTITAHDEELAQRYPWIRPSRTALAESALGRNYGAATLVRLRRHLNDE